MEQSTVEAAEVKAMELIAPLDAMFLLSESREHPMHVAGLQVFEPDRKSVV